MQPDALLASLKARFSGNRAGRITISADEVAEWPNGLFERLQRDGLLTRTEPGQSLECWGCERACFMAVNVVAADGERPARAFISCDKPENMGRVPVAFSRLHQWIMTEAGFERMQRTWIATPEFAASKKLSKSKAPLSFRIALESLLAVVEVRAAEQGLPFDRNAMPGRKVDFQAVAEKFDPILEHTARTFDDYLEGLCAFRRGARMTKFYSSLFPEYFK